MRLNRRWALTSIAIAVLLLIISITSFAGTWTRMKDMPDDGGITWDNRLVEINGLIYVLGGGPPLIYDSGYGKWAVGADMITRRTTMAVVAYNGLIYCMGGQGSANQGVNEVYDPGADTWTKLTDMIYPCWGVQASIVDGVIYVIGGNGPLREGGGDWSTYCRAYNPHTDTWTEKTDMPNKQGWFETDVIDKKIYVTGGWQGVGLQIYDTETDTWADSGSKLSTTSNWGVSTTVHKGQIYVFGGLGWTANAFKIYDPKTDTLVKDERDDNELLPYVTTRSSALTVNDRIYLMGGQWNDSLVSQGIPSGARRQVYIYDPLAAPPMNRFSAAKRAIGPNIDSKEKLIATWGKLKKGVDVE